MDIKEALTFDGLKYFYTKYIKPLKTGAFSTVVNNATTTVANTVLDGRMGKTLADKDANLQSQINTLNSSLTNHSHAWGNITGKPGTFTPSTHTHDDRYYTESEINTKINSINSSLSNLGTYSEGNGSPNTNVLNGGASCKWHKCGKICHVEAVFSTKSTLADYALLFSGLPKAAYNQNFFFPATDSNGHCKNGNLEIGVTGQIHENWYNKPTPGVNVKCGFVYITQ